MSTTPTPPPKGSLLDRLLSIADLAASGISAVTTGTPIGAGASMADILIKMGQHAAAAYEAETGQPYDLSKIPQEDLVPDPNAPKS